MVKGLEGKIKEEWLESLSLFIPEMRRLREGFRTVCSPSSGEQMCRC